MLRGVRRGQKGGAHSLQDVIKLLVVKQHGHDLCPLLRVLRIHLKIGEPFQEEGADTM